jgi:hypothetical protein
MAGDSMDRALRNDFKVKVRFVRAAVTQEQIQRLSLQTRPTKKSTHCKSWTGGESVELDSMPPSEIRALVEKCITQHIDQHAWEQIKIAEAEERATFKSIRDFGKWGAA